MLLLIRHRAYLSVMQISSGETGLPDPKKLVKISAEEQNRVGNASMLQIFQRVNEILSTQLQNLSDIPSQPAQERIQKRDQITGFSADSLRRLSPM